MHRAEDAFAIPASAFKPSRNPEMTLRHGRAQEAQLLTGGQQRRGRQSTAKGAPKPVGSSTVSATDYPGPSWPTERRWITAGGGGRSDLILLAGG
jgi:hypothetical protein